MEKFIMDMMAFVYFKIQKNCEKISTFKEPENMTEEEYRDFHYTFGYNGAFSDMQDFMMEHYRMYCEKEKEKGK